MNELAGWASEIGTVLPHHLNDPARPFHLFPILMPDLNTRTQLIDFAKGKDVFLTFHYVPLHHSPGGEKFGRYSDDFTNTQNISDTLVRLPLFSDMNSQHMEAVVNVLRKFQCDAKNG
jgi:dTDP-4-amino-4,6-dideoxygalactose transaminase